MVMKSKAAIAFATNVLWIPFAFADGVDAYDKCLLEQIKLQSGEKSIDSIRQLCQAQEGTIAPLQTTSSSKKPQTVEQPNDVQVVAASADGHVNQGDSRTEDYDSLVEQRVESERETAFEPYVITAHRLNYLLPVTYTDSINRDAYSDTSWGDNLKNTEAEFQISFKVPLNYSDMFFDGDGLYFGMTLKSFWQVYSKEISSPFRETNYRPEVFYVAPTPWEPFGGQTAFGIGFEHESNGQRQILSRSWNRVYGQFYFAKDNFALTFQPWWRIPEDEKDSEDDARGDDNPDIEDYMGHFELSSVYKWQEMEFSFLGRENFSTHKGYAELGMTFPIWGKIRGYAKYSAGYGSSMIDYNKNQQRVGLGIAITELL